MPLFFMLLDMAIINAFLASRDRQHSSRIPHLTQQRAFRMRLAWNLVILGARMLDEDWTRILTKATPLQPRYRGRYRSGAVPRGNNRESRRQGYVSKHRELDPVRHNPGDHLRIRLYPREKACVLCRYRRNVQRVDVKVHNTRYGCGICGPQNPLCEDCFGSWHRD